MAAASLDGDARIESAVYVLDQYLLCIHSNYAVDLLLYLHITIIDIIAIKITDLLKAQRR